MMRNREKNESTLELFMFFKCRGIIPAGDTSSAQGQPGHIGWDMSALNPVKPFIKGRKREKKFLHGKC